MADLGRKQNFNPRSPCGERLLYLIAWIAILTDFNPRSPCGERQLVDVFLFRNRSISIHAPRVGSDKYTPLSWPRLVISIHAPRVGSDADKAAKDAATAISIHAPRVGSDFLLSSVIM